MARRRSKKPKDESSVENNIDKKTPYQGSRRCFGNFKCPCGNGWSSSHSWANMGQKCFKCTNQQMVYPHAQVIVFTLLYHLWLFMTFVFQQWPIKRSKNKTSGPDKAHKRDLCEKCHKTRGYCGASRKIDPK